MVSNPSRTLPFANSPITRVSEIDDEAMMKPAQLESQPRASASSNPIWAVRGEG